MKKIIVIIICFTYLNLHSQISSGKIIYNVLTQDIESNLKDPKSLLLDKLIVENARKQSFILEFNKNKSSFTKIEKLAQPSHKEKLVESIASGFLTTPNNYFLDQDAENYLLQTDEGILIQKPFKSLNWEILKESKMVDHYLCYKATCNKVIINMKGEEKNISVIAWFAPSLPYHFGPKEFYGLPGLILELEEGKTTFYATEVSLLDLKKEIEFPRGKTITDEEYRKSVLAQQY